MYNNDIFTVPASLTGMPAISIPINFTKEGLPISIQLTAPHFKENILFQVGNFLEKSANFVNNINYKKIS